jgi:hypothetical protein
VALYSESPDESGWVLDVEAATEKSRLDDFRNTNVSLLKERNELKKRFEGIDPAWARRFRNNRRARHVECAFGSDSNRPGRDSLRDEARALAWCSS